jgi:hypothetical protein
MSRCVEPQAVYTPHTVRDRQSYNVEQGGPFMMNSKAEITPASRGFHSGKFDAVPRQARPQYR